MQPDSVDDGEADDVHGKKVSSLEPYAEPAGQVPVSNVTQPSDGSDLDKVSQRCSSIVILVYYQKSNF